MKKPGYSMDAIERIEWAIHETAVHSSISAQECVSRMGVNYKTFLNKALPDSSDNFTTSQLIALIHSTKNTLVPNELLLLCEQPSGHENLLTNVLMLSKENGDLAEAIGDALGDGMLSANEEAAIYRELDDVESALKKLRSAVRSRGNGVSE